MEPRTLLSMPAMEVVRRLVDFEDLVIFTPIINVKQLDYLDM
jgi:hypothetical protein